MFMKSSIKKAFTLTEVIVVVLIIGVLVGLALPNIANQIRRIRNQEAKQILIAVYDAQIEYNKINGEYADTIGVLDVEIDEDNIKNFKDLTVAANEAFSCPDSGGVLASGILANITANNDSYKLYILSDGTIFCTDSASLCGASGCRKMGFLPPT